MPVLADSDYRPPWWLPGAHAQTIFPVLYRRQNGVGYTRERMEIGPGDFLSLDWLKAGGDRIALIVHGLEGNSFSHTVMGMARAFRRRGWDAVAMNHRGCDGEECPGVHTYHGGSSDEVLAVLRSVASRGYRRVVLIGISLGGNQVLKLLGESPAETERLLEAAITISVPCDLATASDRIDAPGGAIYRRHFLRRLMPKAQRLHRLRPDLVPDPQVLRPHTLRMFDDLYTAPVNGFLDADDYYQRVSCLRHLPGIRVPTLILNARNDPMLSPSCYPTSVAAASNHLFLELPSAGGHAGFTLSRGDGEYWSERRALRFVGEEV